MLSSDWIYVLAARVINPDNVLFPDVDLIAPFDDTPDPDAVIASPILIPPEICKTAPSAIVVAPSVVPRLVALVAIRTPWWIVVAPV